MPPVNLDRVHLLTTLPINDSYTHTRRPRSLHPPTHKTPTRLFKLLPNLLNRLVVFDFVTFFFFIVVGRRRTRRVRIQIFVVGIAGAIFIFILFGVDHDE